MKTKKNERILVAAFLILGILSGFAQSQVSLIPNPLDLAQCPAINTVFTLSSNFNPSCHTITADENATIVAINTNSNTNVSTVTINFFDNGMRAKITIGKLSDSGCSGAANGRVYDKIPIKTLVGIVSDNNWA
jgi:hypothetical protein